MSGGFYGPRGVLSNFEGEGVNLVYIAILTQILQARVETHVLARVVTRARLLFKNMHPGWVKVFYNFEKQPSFLCLAKIS